ncbi:transcriptional regulator FtrA [Rhizobium leguminosarum]|nr:transcriptional regulator FtrA [Rhizobium leguminosarum]
MREMTPAGENRHLVVALAYDGLCTFEFGLAVEIFGLPRPEMGSKWYRFAVAAVDDGPLRALGGIRVEADGGFELLAMADTIIVPGWRGIDCAVPGNLVTALQGAHTRGARILSICSGVFVLAAAGLLAGKRATTHWRYTDALASGYPEVRVAQDVLYVDEGDILTSAGSAAGIDLCLHLVRRDFGADAANSVARRLVIPSHRHGDQAQIISRPVPDQYEASRLSPLLDYMRDSLSSQHTVAKLARRVGMSKRTFLRRFEASTGVTPAQWMLAERLARAKELLESSLIGVERVAELSGFGSAAALRHHFRRRFGATPISYRQAERFA